MVSPFQLVAEKLAEAGVFNFVLPWMITSAIFYGMLEKAKIFEGIAVRATLSLAFSFFIWGYFVTASAVELGAPLAKFITQFSVIAIAVLLALLGASLAFPDFAEALTQAFKGGSWIWVMIIITFLLFFLTSGLGTVLGVDKLVGSNAGVLALVFLFIFLGVLIAVQTGGGGG